MLLQISLISCQLNVLLVQSNQAEIIIREHNNVNRVRVESRSFDQVRRQNDAFTHLVTLPFAPTKSNFGAKLLHNAYTVEILWSKYKCNLFERFGILKRTIIIHQLFKSDEIRGNNYTFLL